MQSLNKEHTNFLKPPISLAAQGVFRTRAAFAMYVKVCSLPCERSVIFCAHLHGDSQRFVGMSEQTEPVKEAWEQTVAT